MKSFKIISVIAGLCLIVFCYAFKSPAQQGGGISIVKVYLTGENDFESGIVVCKANGTSERIALMPHKAKVYQINDQKIVATLNSMISTGYKLKDVTSEGSGGGLHITTYVFEN